ncbi:hypothetical protein CC80DRAFT_496029 [Byssothecium circinans]|uniref:UBA domain-containing protein n=1 Tax=Byssothecium circinans TaxID=147558 RepID=A0A6A5TH12_9PLEO|nr:hypothetical protein CC80DRAFT_496029 [Byssothecium circinans]
MRIVQDSEDEDDLEIEAGDAAPKDASRDEPSLQQEEEKHGHGTGSTESLKRTIEDAHREHFQSPPRASSEQHAPHSSGSLPEHANKRRKTSLDASTAESPRVSSARKKAHVTYGKSPGSTFNTPPLEQQLNEPITVPTIPLPDKPWKLQDSVGEQWQYHEPMAMFAEPSSTIPNATATQQRLLQEATAPAFPGLEDAPPYEPAKSSIPWSEYLKSSEPPVSVKSTSQPELPSDQQQGSVPQEDSSGGVKAEMLQDTADTTGIMKPPSLPTQASSGTGLDGAATSPRTKKISMNNPQGPKEPRRSPRPNRKSQEAINVLSPPTKTQPKSSSLANLEDDFLVDGIPKEQYKPRPSRSRSLKHTIGEPVDYSVRPEKAARKPRRTRTTSAMETGSATTTPEKVQQICDMGFTPSTTKIALRQNNGDMTSTLDWLIGNGAADEDELAPPKSSKLKKDKANKEYGTLSHVDEVSHNELADTGKRDARVSFNTAAGTAITPAIENVSAPAADSVNEPLVPTPSKSPKVSVVIPKLRAQTSTSNPNDALQAPTTSPRKRNMTEIPRSKAKRRKTALDQPEPSVDEASAVTLVTVQPPKEKRKRGRPKKETKSAESVSEEQIDNTHAESNGKGPALQEIQANGPAAAETATVTEQTSPETIPIPSEHHTASLPPKTTAIPAVDDMNKDKSQTPQKPSNSANPTPTTQTKGKNLYRVGLSKRARIAPLLRTLKK